MTKRRKPKLEDLIPPPPAPHIRWMIRRDMDEVLAIENERFEFPWCENDFIRVLRQRNAIGLVVDYDEQAVAYVIYELHKRRLHILGIAVDSRFDRRGFGRMLIEKLVGKLNPDRRVRISAEVRETNLGAQLFFKACGFRAVSVVRGLYRDTDEDAYIMQYRLSLAQEAEIRQRWQECY